MAEVDSAAVPQQRARGPEQTLRTTPATEDAVRALTRALAVKVGRTPSHDEVIAAAVAIGTLHQSLLEEYVKERAR